METSPWRRHHIAPALLHTYVEQCVCVEKVSVCVGGGVCACACACVCVRVSECVSSD